MKPTVHIHERRTCQKIHHNGSDLDGNPIGDGMPDVIRVKGPTEITIVVEREHVIEEWEEFQGYACELNSTRPTKS